MCHLTAVGFTSRWRLSSYEQYYQFNLLSIPVSLETEYPYTHTHTQVVKRKQAEVFSKTQVEYVGKKYVVEYVNELILKKKLVGGSGYVEMHIHSVSRLWVLPCGRQTSHWTLRRDCRVEKVHSGGRREECFQLSNFSLWHSSVIYIYEVLNTSLGPKCHWCEILGEE